MPSFDTEDGSIYYEVLNATGRPAGEVPDLVLLHNFMSTGRAAWGPMLDSLFLRYRVLLPDLPGHGQSIGYPEGFDHGIIARQLAALLAAENASSAHLAGCSSGGMIVQLLVHHGLVSPASLTLVSTTYSNRYEVLGSPERTPRDFRAGRNWLDATAKLHDPYRTDRSFRSDGYEAGYYANVLLPGFRDLRPETTIDLPLTALAGWTLPVSLIHGERDEFFPIGIAEEMAAILPNAELHPVPEQSHSLIFRQPWKVLRLMETFLRRQPMGQSQTINFPEND